MPWARIRTPASTPATTRPGTPETIRWWPTAWPASPGRPTSGPRSSVLLTDTKELIAYWHRRGVQPTSDLVTTSGSGLDPDITPDDARAEIPMVSRSTGLSTVVLHGSINQQSQGMQLGFLGSPYVNVLQLNEALVKLEG